MVDLARALYAQRKILEAEKEIITYLPKESRNVTGQTDFILRAEAGSILALCFSESGDRALAQTTMIQSMAGADTPKSTQLPYILANAAILQAQLGNEIRSQRLFSECQGSRQLLVIA